MNIQSELEDQEKELPMLNTKPMFDKKGVFWFLGLTFGLTWLIDLVVYLNGGLRTPVGGHAAILAAMMPAFSAILLGLFFFPESPIYHKRPAGRGRWFYFFFLLYTLIAAVGVLYVWLDPSDGMGKIVALATQLPYIVGLFLVVVLRFTAGRQAMARVWLSWGKGRYWLLFGLGIAVFYILATALNALFGLGPSEMVLRSAPQGFHPILYTILISAGTALFASVVMSFPIFGEEYGWRGYLQSELFKLGRVRGVLLLGAIWGAWHWPLILMGFNYPGHPLPGLLLMVLYSTGEGIVLGYAVLKSGSILLAAFLHAVGNVLINTLVDMGFMPFDRIFNFYNGIPMLPILTVICFFILRDPIWREVGGNLPQPEPAPIDTTLSSDPVAAGKAAEQVNLGTTS
jgi:membrane protease YdiL (CAAX protease family)